MVILYEQRTVPCTYCETVGDGVKRLHTLGVVLSGKTVLITEERHCATGKNSLRQPLLRPTSYHAQLIGGTPI